MTQPYKEELSPQAAEKWRALAQPEETVQVQVAGDMLAGGVYGARWLVATDQRLVMVPEAGADGAVQLTWDEVAGVQTQDFVGGGRLEIERHQGEPEYFYYSASLLPRFGELVEGLRELSKGEDPALPTHMERTRCETCARILPEKDGICPFCVNK